MIKVLSAALLSMFVITASLYADMRPVPGSPIPRPTVTPPPVIFQKSTACNRACSNGVLALTFMRVAGETLSTDCPTQPDVTISCGGFACEQNGKNCKTSCAAPTDCGRGFTCLAGSCLPAQNRCANDLRSVIDAEGREYSCSVYLCEAGRCKDRCTDSINDCVPGYSCWDGVCRNAPPQ